MLPSSNADAQHGQIVMIPRYDRWSLYRRLQELQIPCVCCPDGSLRADVSHGLALVLLRSAVQQLTASRAELVSWLSRCWAIQSHPRDDREP